MKPRISSDLICLFICVAVALAGCKRKDVPAANPGTAVAAGNAIAPSTDAAPPPVAPAVKPFDLQSVPLSTTAMPPFPFVDLPAKVAEGYPNKDSGFDQAFVLAGNALLPVEGHVSLRFFPLHVANMSSLAAYRNYDQAIKSMGGVQVNAAHPLDKTFVTQNGGSDAILKRLRIPNIERSIPSDTPTFAQYLVRTARNNIWISFFIFDDENNVGLLVIEEKPLEQAGR